MDINYLLRRQQISIMHAAEAAGPEARLAHEGLARGYTDRLRILGLPESVLLAKPSLSLEAI